jgi:hypothetical protein
VVGNIDHHHEWKVDLLKATHAAGKEIVCWSMAASPTYFDVISPRMVQFVLKDNFENFIKSVDAEWMTRSSLRRGAGTADSLCRLCCCSALLGLSQGSELSIDLL